MRRNPSYPELLVSGWRPRRVQTTVAAISPTNGHCLPGLDVGRWPASTALYMNYYSTYVHDSVLHIEDLRGYFWLFSTIVALYMHIELHSCTESFFNA